jgi:hypothetical protein
MDRSIDRTTCRRRGSEREPLDATIPPLSAASAAQGVRVGAGIIHRAARENPECYALVMAAAVQPGAAAIASIARVWNHFFPDTPARFVPILPTARFDIVISPGDTEMRIDLIDGVARGWVTAYLDHVGARGVSVTPVSAEAAPGVWTLQCRFALPLERRRLAVEHALAWLARNTDLLTGNGLTGGGYRVASSPIDAAGRTTASALTFPTTAPSLWVATTSPVASWRSSTSFLKDSPMRRSPRDSESPRAPSRSTSTGSFARPATSRGTSSSSVGHFPLPLPNRPPDTASDEPILNASIFLLISDFFCLLICRPGRKITCVS